MDGYSRPEPSGRWQAPDTGPTGTPIAESLVVENPQTFHWDESCDLLVVGCGLAGATTALKVGEEDATVSVMVADRFEGGGTTQLSGGVIYVGGGTDVQKQLGITDTVEDMARYLSLETGNVVSRATLDRFCAESASFLPWLGRFGIRFGGPMTEDKTMYPFNNEFLYYSGNERLQDSKAVAKPAPRGHRPLPRDGSTVSDGLSGRDLMDPLKRALERAPNISFKRQTAARRLIMDRAGRVIGAELWQIPPGSLAARAHRRLANVGSSTILRVLRLTNPLLRTVMAIERKAARPIRVRARKGVTLASGGYAFNSRMFEAVTPLYHKLFPLGTVGDDGSGIMLGQMAGGNTEHMDVASAWRFLYAPESWVKGILVGSRGGRIINEEAYGARTGAAIFEQSEGLGWLILDQPLFEKAKVESEDPRLFRNTRYWLKATFTRYCTKADTLAGLSAAIGLQPGMLEATLQTYNQRIAEGRSDEFGKADKYRCPITQGPFYALDMSYRTILNPISGITTGGLAVNEETGIVIRPDGTPVEGLYAVGRAAAGIPSKFYVSGLSLADCIWSGWRAARTVLRQAA